MCVVGHDLVVCRTYLVRAIVKGEKTLKLSGNGSLALVASVEYLVRAACHVSGLA